jgi:hypothetical protein
MSSLSKLHLVQGGELYWTFAFSKGSLDQQLMEEHVFCRGRHREGQQIFFTSFIKNKSVKPVTFANN